MTAWLHKRFGQRREAHVTPYPMLEDGLLTALSLLVVAAFAMVVVMPGRLTLAVSVSPNAGGASGTALIYGALKNASGLPLSGAQIRGYDSSGRLVMNTTADKDGTFDKSLRVTSGPFRIVVTYVMGGVTYTGEITLNVTPGYKYGIIGSLSSGGGFAWTALPVY